MSARHRQIKRRIRDLEDLIAHTAETIRCYERVLLDLPYLEAEKRLVRVRLAWHVERQKLLGAELRHEEELLASMPKRLGESPHDAGDEQEHRDRRPGERP